MSFWAYSLGTTSKNTGSYYTDDLPVPTRKEMLGELWEGMRGTDA